MVAANIILRFVPALLVHFFSGIPTIGTSAHKLQRIKPHLLMKCWHPCLRLKPGELYIPRDVTLKRDFKTHWRDVELVNKEENALRAVIHPPPKNVCGILITPKFGPSGCPSVLEAKIEIPDTPVVNFAHASPALEQDLLVAVALSSRMWNMQEMRLGWKTVPHNKNILPLLPTPWPVSFVNADGSVCLGHWLCVGDGDGEMDIK